MQEVPPSSVLIWSALHQAQSGRVQHGAPILQPSKLRHTAADAHRQVSGMLRACVGGVQTRPDSPEASYLISYHSLPMPERTPWGLCLAARLGGLVSSGLLGTTQNGVLWHVIGTHRPGHSESREQIAVLMLIFLVTSTAILGLASTPWG